MAMLSASALRGIGGARQVQQRSCLPKTQRCSVRVRYTNGTPESEAKQDYKQAKKTTQEITEPLSWQATDGYDAQGQLNEVWERVQAKWEESKDKKTVIAVSVGGLFALWLSGRVLSSLDRLPLVGDLLTFTGLVWTANVFWKYILFADGRKELRSYLSQLYTSAKDVVEGEGVASNNDSDERSKPIVSAAEKAQDIVTDRRKQNKDYNPVDYASQELVPPAESSADEINLDEACEGENCGDEEPLHKPARVAQSAGRGFGRQK